MIPQSITIRLTLRSIQIRPRLSPQLLMSALHLPSSTILSTPYVTLLKGSEFYLKVTAECFSRSRKALFNVTSTLLMSSKMEVKMCDSNRRLIQINWKIKRINFWNTHMELSTLIINFGIQATTSRIILGQTCMPSEKIWVRNGYTFTSNPLTNLAKPNF